jgi:hypothetical protein
MSSKFGMSLKILFLHNESKGTVTLINFEI